MATKPWLVVKLRGRGPFGIPMQKPGTRIIGYESDGHVVIHAARRHCVSSDRGVEVVVGLTARASYDSERMLNPAPLSHIKR